MNSQRTAAWTLDEEIANAGATSRGNQVPPLEEFDDDDQDLVNPPPLWDTQTQSTT